METVLPEPEEMEQFKNELLEVVVDVAGMLPEEA